MKGGNKIHAADTKDRTLCGEKYNELDSVESKDDFINILQNGSKLFDGSTMKIQRKFFCEKCLHSLGV